MASGEQRYLADQELVRPALIHCVRLGRAAVRRRSEEPLIFTNPDEALGGHITLKTPLYLNRRFPPYGGARRCYLWLPAAATCKMTAFTLEHQIKILPDNLDAPARIIKINTGTASGEYDGQFDFLGPTRMPVKEIAADLALFRRLRPRDLTTNFSGEME